MNRFPASWEAFEMLRRLVFRGKMRGFNTALANELIAAGFATVEGDKLVATTAGIKAERSLMRLPRPALAA